MPTTITPNIADLARQVDCFAEVDVAALAGVKPSTLEAWRKRGKGPDYVLLGCNYLYPRKSLENFLQSLLKNRSEFSAKDVLL